MTGPGGPVSVPHSWVVDAATRGYDFANNDDRQRYKDKSHPANWDLTDIPVVGKFLDNTSRRLSANLQNMSEVVAGPHPLDTLLHGTTEGEEMFGNPNAPVANMTGDILSLLAQDKAISSLATPSLRLKAASAAFETVEKLPPSLQRVVAAGLEESRLGRATQGAVTGAPALAAQDLLTGRGAKQAAVSGAIGTVMPFATEGAGAVISKTGKVTQNVLDRFKQPTVDIGSKTGVPVEAQQLGEEGEILPTGTKTAKTARDQQAAFDADMLHSAKRALRVSLQNLNDAIGPTERPMLPPPSGEDMPVFHLTGPPTEEAGATSPLEQAPGTYQRQGPPTTENAPAGGYREYNGQTGEIGKPVQEGATPLTQEAKPIPRSATTTPASYAGPFERTTEGGVSAERRISGAMHPGPEASEAARRDVVGGGGISGPVNNPAEAVAYRNQYRQIMDSPEFKNFTPEQQAQVTQYHDWLTGEIGAYYAQPHGGIIPADIASATEHALNLGDAADQLKNQITPGLNELDHLTDGKINQLSKEIQQANSTLYDPKSNAADKAEAWRTIHANDAEITNQIQRHAGDTNITRQYYNALKQGYADSSFLRNVNNVIEGWSNGITRENTANSSTLKRVISADPADFENFLSKGNNRQQLARLMGPQAEESIKSWGQLLSNPATARKTGTTLESVAAQMNRLKWQITGGGGTAILSHVLGISYPAAAAVSLGAVGATVGARVLMRQAAMSPTVTNLVRYAVENNVDTRIAAPLIARAIASLSGPQGPQPEQQPQQ